MKRLWKIALVLLRLWIIAGADKKGTEKNNLIADMQFLMDPNFRKLHPTTEKSLNYNTTKNMLEYSTIQNIRKLQYDFSVVKLWIEYAMRQLVQVFP